MKAGAREIAEPAIRIAVAGDAENLGPGGHPVAEFLRERRERASSTPSARSPVHVNAIVTQRASGDAFPTDCPVPTLSPDPPATFAPPPHSRS